MPTGIKKTIAKRPAANAKMPAANAGVKKRPSASQSGNPGDAEGWGDFQAVPFSETSETKQAKNYLHLKLEGEFKEEPVVVKHIQNGSLHTSTGCQSVKDFLKSLQKKGDPAWLQEWDAASTNNKKNLFMSNN